LSRAYTDFYHESPHNIFLDALTSQGVLGLSLLLALCGIALRHSKDNPPLAAGLTAALVSLQFTSFTIATAFAFLTLIAALGAKATPVLIERQARVWRVVPVLFTVVLIVAGYRLMISDWHLQQAKLALDADRTVEAHQEYLAASDWAIAGGGSDLYISRRFASKGRLGEALEAGVRATRSAEDRQNAFYNLAALHAASGDAAAVETDLKAAILCSPQWYKAHWTLAELYERQKKFEDAARESEIAFELAGGKHTEVAGTRDRILAKRNQ
jgi:tetratricopeptide (TPR) repeat protein